MKRQGLIFQLNESDVESAVMQFICACHPDVATGYRIAVYNQSGCTAIAIDGTLATKQLIPPMIPTGGLVVTKLDVEATLKRDGAALAQIQRRVEILEEKNYHPCVSCNNTNAHRCNTCKCYNRLSDNYVHAGWPGEVKDAIK